LYELSIVNTEMKNLFILIISLFFIKNAFSQVKSNRGKEFWLSYGFNYNFFHDNPNTQDLAVYISTTTQPAVVTITISGTAYNQTLNIPANTTDASIIIPKSGVNDARILTDGLSTKGIHIVSNVDVACFAHVYGTQVSGATMLMPVNTYGYTYRSINYSQFTSGSNLPNQSATTQNGPDWYSWFYVIASEDNTRLEITPSDTTKNGWLPNQTYIVNLNKGEIYNVFGKLAGGNALWAASKDMTGSKVNAIVGADGKCHPFAMFSGSGGIRICKGDGGEFMHQQVFPIQAWGTKYLTYHTINNGNSDINETNRNYYRICVNDPTTVVKANGVVLTGLQNNFYYSLMDSISGFYIEANKPIIVAQYTTNKNQCWGTAGGSVVGSLSYGDPEMFYLSPLEQGQKNISFYVSRKMTIDYAYANIILPTNAISSLRVDNVAVPSTQIITHPFLPNYSVALTRFIGPAAPHQITCDSNVLATVYGLGNFESYGYNAGCNIENLNNISEIKNTFSSSSIADSSTCTKTNFRIKLKLAYAVNSITWKFSQVPGITPNVDSIQINPIPIATEIINGRTYYVYTLNQDFSILNVGTYNLPIAYTTPEIVNCNQTEYDSLPIIVKQGPQSDFTYTPIISPPCFSDTLNFSGFALNATGFSINQYRWDFADATFATTINTSKKFNSFGSQNVRFRVFATDGCIGDTIKPVFINASPIAKFGMSTNSICVRDSVQITDTSSIANGSITNYTYYISNGSIISRTTNTAFYIPFNTAGNFSIKLVVTSGLGCKSDTFTRLINIIDRPIAKFGIDRNICVNDSIRLTDSSTLVAATTNLYHWDFGNGTTLIRNTNTPFYKPYTASGTYIVKLVIVSSNGCPSDTFSKQVNVSAKPAVNFNMIGKPCIDSLYTFTSTFAVGAVPPVRFYWNFGDGQFANSTTSNTITHNYALTGGYTIKHLIDLGGGCYSDTITQTIPIINANPIANFTIDKDTLCVSTPLLFTSTVVGNYSWNWNFGNGLSTQIPPFTRSYNSAGNYAIQLKIIDANGCGSSIINDNITISSNPLVNAGIDKIVQLGSSVNLNAAVTPTGNYNYTWSPATALSSTNILNPVASPTTSIVYTLQAVDPIANCIGTDQVLISVFDKLYIPTVFTPNNDGVNDKWDIQGIALYPNAVVKVYNRYGNKVFESKNYFTQPWLGLHKSQQVPSGVYVYVIELNNTAKEVKKGTLVVAR
jgi:gliding motility-associated-like protein